MSARRVTLDVPLAPGEPVQLPDDVAHYLGRVLRLASGDPLDVVDADGARWRGTVRFAADGAHVDDITLAQAAEASAPLVVVASLIKAGPWEWMLQKATELGATRIIPVAAARSVVRIPGERAQKKAARWQRICDDAVRQCERLNRVVVAEPTTLQAALTSISGTPIFFDETRPETPWPDLAPDEGLTLVTGPEGGFTDAERALLRDVGAVGVGLGPALLKAETATVAGLAYIRLRRAGLVGP